MQVTLPVSCEQYDPSTFNNNLPFQNDVGAPVTIPPGFDQQFVGSCIANFRLFAQTRVQKSGLHCFVYNLLCQNRWQNQTWQYWCQRAVDFAEFLVRAQNNPVDVAIKKSSEKTYTSLLADTLARYQTLSQYIRPEMHQTLIQAANENQLILRDLAGFKQAQQAQYAQPQQYGAYAQPQQPGLVYASQGVMPMGQPPVGYTQSPAQYTVAATAGVGSYAPYIPQSTASTPAAAGSAPLQSVGEPLQIEIVSGSASKTTKVGDTPNTWTAGSGYSNRTETAAPAAPIQPAMQEAPMETNQPIPQTVEELVIDPNYAPQGPVNVERPYDLIWNPGGVEIRPAHQTNWKRTVGDDQQYACLYDPSAYIRFLAKWPDGVVKEVIVPINESMQYLKHEIDEQLKARYIKPAGKQIISTKRVLDLTGAAESLATQVERRVEEDLDVKDLKPAVLEVLFKNSTDLENEIEARRHMVDALQLDDTQPVPPHEYQSTRFYPMDIDQVTYDALANIAKLTNYPSAMQELKALIDNGQLSVRSYKVINDRICRFVNDFLHDSLSLNTINITDSITDTVELIEYLKQDKYGVQYSAAYAGNAKSVLAKALNVAVETDEEDGTTFYGVADVFVNYQLGFTLADRLSLNFEDGLVLVSKVTNPKLVEVIRDMVKRIRDTGMVGTVIPRLITADGQYLQIVQGMLVQNSLLLKKL